MHGRDEPQLGRRPTDDKRIGDGRDEATLLLKARDGDTDAYTAIVDRYKNLVYGLAYYRLRNFEDARDVAQNVFLAVYQHLGQLDDLSKFTAWLRRITNNACAAHLRRVQETVPIDPAQMETADAIGALLTRLAVQQALTCLSDETRLTLILYYFQSYSTSEIAGFLGVPVTTIKSRLRDGRARLKKEMFQMVEQTLRQEPLDADFARRCAALADAAVRGKADTAADLLREDHLLANSFGDVAEEHREFMRQHDSDSGWTPLHLAAHYGQIEIVRLLLDHGAEIDAVSQNAIGNTPLSAAGWGNRLDIVTLLLDRGAKVDAPNRGGATTLHRAVQADRAPLAELLISRGADPNARDNDGNTPLTFARQQGNAEMIALLTQHGATI